MKLSQPFHRAVALLWLGGADLIQAQHHYVFFNRDRERIVEQSFLDAVALEGAQLKYAWRELEPTKDIYDFTPIRNNLAFLSAKGKKLFIQLQDVSFDESIVNVPRYLQKDSEYNGGVARQYRTEGRARVPEGWVARRWDPAVRDRFYRLLSALGAEFDGKIEGINLPETAIGVGEDGDVFPRGFTFELYRDTVIANMAALKKAFPKSVAMQYANFMPGEWIPASDKLYLRGVYQAARKLGVGVGGPDLLPYRRGQLLHSYPLIKESAGIVPTGIAVQTGNYEHKDPKTGKRVTIPGLHRFARDNLKVEYIFWSTQEPFYSKDLLPYLKSAKGRGAAVPIAGEQK